MKTPKTVITWVSSLILITASLSSGGCASPSDGNIGASESRDQLTAEQDLVYANIKQDPSLGYWNFWEPGPNNVW